MEDVTLAIFSGLVVITLSLMCDYASPETVRSFILGGIILNALVVLGIILYLITKGSMS